MLDDDLVSFARLVEALRPWHGQMVIVGGWAHRLHRLLPEARVPNHQPIRTLDADVAFDSSARISGRIGEALAAAGFHEELFPKHDPPVSCYWLGEGRTFYVEFLTPMSGSPHRRDGSPDATVQHAGVTAQKLRYVELLLTGPALISLAPDGPIPVSETAAVLVAHPACFIAQKLVIAERRKPDKRAQDVLYVHDTLELFAGALDSLRAHWNASVRGTLHLNTTERIERALGEQYGSVTDAIRRAALIPQDRRLDPARLRLVCELGLQQLLGNPR